MVRVVVFLFYSCVQCMGPFMGMSSLITHSEYDCLYLPYWNDGEPNDSNGEDCAETRVTTEIDKLLNDESCSLSRYFVCDLQNISVADSTSLSWSSSR